MKRFLAVMGAVVLGSFAFAGVASADDYPASEPAIQVSDTSPEAGTPVTISGEGYDAGEQVSFTVTEGTEGAGLRAPSAAFVSVVPTIPPVTAAPDGTFSTQVTFDDPGTYTVVATGATSGVSNSVTISVQAAASEGGTSGTEAGNGGAAGSGSLSSTGVNRTMLVGGSIGGGLAVIVGAGLLWLSITRKPRRQTSA